MCYYIRNMNETYKLSNYSVVSTPSGSQTFMRQTGHLKMDRKVAITVKGLKEHNEHNMFTKVGLAASFGIVALPILGITGGIGIAMGGEAIGLGLAELTVASTLTATATGVGIANTTKLKGHKVNHNEISLINMVGSIKEIKQRWFDQEGYDILIEWKFINEWGDVKTTRTWHNPGDLVSLEYNA